MNSDQAVRDAVRRAPAVGFAAIGLSALLLTSAPAWAGASFTPATRVFRLDGGDVTYAFGVTDAGMLQATYWGPRLAAGDTLEAQAPARVSSLDPTNSVSAQEYPGWGGGFYTEPALKVAFPDGVRDVVLHYVSGRADATGVTVELADLSRPIGVTLHYTIDDQTGSQPVLGGLLAHERERGLQQICMGLLERHVRERRHAR